MGDRSVLGGPQGQAADEVPLQMKKTIRVGIAASRAPAAIRLLSVKNTPWRFFSAAVTGNLSPVGISTRAQKKSL